MGITITYDTATRRVGISDKAFRRVRNRVAKLHPRANWYKDHDRLQSRMEIVGDLPEVVRGIRAAVIEALGDEASTVMVSVHATRSERPVLYALGTVGTPDDIRETYSLG